MTGWYVFTDQALRTSLSTNHDQIQARRKTTGQTDLRKPNCSPNRAQPTDPAVNQVRANLFDVARNYSRCHS